MRSRCFSALVQLLLGCLFVLGSANSTNNFPSTINLTAGVFHVPPYIFLEQDDNETSISPTGFCPDMLERLQIFAAQDNVTLNYEFQVAPPSYDGSIDLIANDCDGEDCDKFDLITVDYYYTTERAMRIEYTPAWLHGAISAVRYVPNTAPTGGEEKENVLSTYVDMTGPAQADEFITMAQASREGHPVCLVEGTSIVPITLQKFPGADFVMCPDQQTCLGQLKVGNCRLYVDDRLQLRYRAVSDPTLVVISETFNPQYVTWVLNERTLNAMEVRLVKRWLIAAHQNGTMGELYEKYFEKEPCPHGRAGPHCERPCHPDHGRANRYGTCVCKSTKWTGADCSVEVPEDLNRIPNSLKVLAYVLLGINGLLIVGCAIWLVANRKSQQVRISQPSFLLLVLLGCAISSSTIVAMAQEDDNGNVPACMAIPWLYSVGFCVTFGTLFAKIRRVYIIFKSSAELKRVQVTFLENLAVIGSVLFIDIVILIVWTALDPLEWQRTVITADQFGDPLESEGHCTSEHWEAFAGSIAALHLALLLVASCMCYVSRHIPTKFSEGKWVAIAMVSNLQIFMVGIPVLVVVGADPAASFFVRSVMITMNDCCVVVLIFGNLIRSVSFSKEEEKEVKAEIRDAIQEFSRHQDHDHDHDHGMDNSWHSRSSDHSAVKRLTPPRMELLKMVNASWQATHSRTSNALSSSSAPHDLSMQSPAGSEEEDHQWKCSLPVIRQRQPNPDFLEQDSWAQVNVSVHDHSSNHEDIGDCPAEIKLSSACDEMKQAPSCCENNMEDSNNLQEASPG